MRRSTVWRSEMPRADRSPTSRSARVHGPDDVVQRSVRLDLRSLNADRLNFNIARQSLISAARQVEAAREELVVNGAQRRPDKYAEYPECVVERFVSREFTDSNLGPIRNRPSSFCSIPKPCK